MEDTLCCLLKVIGKLSDQETKRAGDVLTPIDGGYLNEELLVEC